MSHEQIVQTAVFSLCQHHVLFCTVNLHCCNQSLSKNTCLFNFRCRLDLRKYFNNKLFPIYGSTVCLYEHLWSQGSRVSAFLLYILCKSEGGAKRTLLGYFLSRSRSGFPHSNFSLELSTSGEMYALRTASSGKEGGRESCRWSKRRGEREMEEEETERGERRENERRTRSRREEERCINYQTAALYSVLEYRST